MTPERERARAARVACWLGYAAIGAAAGIFGPLLPVLRHDLHATYATLALLFVAGTVGGGAGTLFGNQLLDRVGYRRLLAASALVLGLMCLGRAVIPSLAAWVALSAVAGLAVNGLDIGGIRYIAQSAGDERNSALNLLNLFYSMGSFAAPLGVSALAAAGANVLWAYTLCALLLFAVAIVSLLAVPPERPESGEGTMVEAWRWAASRPVLVRLGLAVAVYAGLESGFSGWAASYAQSRGHLAVAVAALYPLAFWAAMTVGRSLAAERARYWSEGSLLWAGTALTLTGGIVALAAGGAVGIAVGIGLAGLGSGPIWPSLFALAARASPGHHSEAYGLLYPAASVGVLVVPYLAGQLFDTLGPRAAIALPTVCAVVLVAILALVLGRGAPGSVASRRDIV